MKRRRRPPLPSFPTLVLDAVNTMDRSPDQLEVAQAALMHHALTRGPVPHYHDMLNAGRHADVVLAALYRRGWL